MKRFYFGRSKSQLLYTTGIQSFFADDHKYNPIILFAYILLFTSSWTVFRGGPTTRQRREKRKKRMRTRRRAYRGDGGWEEKEDEKDSEGKQRRTKKRSRKRRGAAANIPFHTLKHIF